jgi:hypothetical protein
MCCFVIISKSLLVKVVTFLIESKPFDSISLGIIQFINFSNL